MSKKVEVEGYSGLVRDQSTNAIINSNVSEYQNYLRMKSKKDEENLRVLDMEEDLTKLKSDIEELKQLLRSLVNDGSRQD
tara:strand:- start:811 stop:1050 length:240 start_codon:yes stop_codon:yes gene_type:complete